MRIAFTFNVRHVKPALEKQALEEAEFDEPETIAAIHAAILENGYECIDIEADENAYERLQKLQGSIDLVFNVAEGLRGEIREAQIPAILEMLGLPYTHSGALAQAVTLDKALTKKIWQYHGLPTPKFVVIGVSDEAPTTLRSGYLLPTLRRERNPSEAKTSSLSSAGLRPRYFAKRDKPYVEARLPSPAAQDAGGQGLQFPLLVKPNSEGSSKGVFNDSLIENPKKLPAKIRDIQRTYGDGVLVEEFLPGREFTVTVMGNSHIGKGPYILPIVEQNYDIFPKKLKKIASYEAKWLFEDSLPNPHDAYICPAKLSPALEKLIEKLCLAAFETTNCRDIARIDLRLDVEGKPQLLEINSMPGMIADPNVVTYYPIAARAAGWDFNRMVGQIITHARERLGI